MKDFLVIDISEARLGVGLAKIRGKNLEISDYVKHELDSGKAGNRAEWLDMLREAFAGTELISRGSGKVVATIPRRDYLVKRVELPDVGREKLSKIITFQAEEYLGLQLNDSTVDFHQAGVTDEGKARVYIVAVRNEVLNSYMDLFKAYNLKPALILPRFLALAECSGGLGLEAVADVGTFWAELAVTGKSEVLDTRSLNFGADSAPVITSGSDLINISGTASPNISDSSESDPDVVSANTSDSDSDAAPIRIQMLKAVLSKTAEGLERLSLVCENETIGGLKAAIDTCELRRLSPESVALGAARFYLSESPSMINLLPGSMIAEQSRSKSTQKRNITAVAIALTIAIAAGGSAWHVKNMEKRADELAVLSSNLTKNSRGTASLLQDCSSLVSEAAAWERRLSVRISWGRLLESITRSVPQDTWLTGLRMETGKKFSITGRSKSRASVADFLKSLSKDPDVSNTDLGYIKDTETAQVVEFSITGELRAVIR